MRNTINSHFNAWQYDVIYKITRTSVILCVYSGVSCQFKSRLAVPVSLSPCPQYFALYHTGAWRVYFHVRNLSWYVLSRIYHGVMSEEVKSVMIWRFSIYNTTGENNRPRIIQLIVSRQCMALIRVIVDENILLLLHLHHQHHQYHHHQHQSSSSSSSLLS